MAPCACESDDVRKLLERARRAGYEVWAPAPGPAGWAFARYDGGAVDVHGYLLTTLSIKSFFLPQRETILTYDGDEARAAATPENQKRLICCVRPCDARAVALLDKVYAGGRGFHDPAYEARRANTIIVVCACEAPAPTCFCTSVGGGPADATGADVILYGLERHLVGEGASPGRGDAFLKELGFAARAPADQLAKAKAAHEKVARAMPVLWDVAKARPRLYENFNAARAWDDVASRCIGCLACTFVCPSCHCFDVVDEGRHGRGARLRFWDGCTVGLFTHHASGHNPRTTKAARYRQRVLHKFHYFYENWSETLCVGCGRCVVACPANVDIREAVALVAREE